MTDPLSVSGLEAAIAAAPCLLSDLVGAWNCKGGRRHSGCAAAAALTYLESEEAQERVARALAGYRLLVRQGKRSGTYKEQATVALNALWDPLEGESR